MDPRTRKCLIAGALMFAVTTLIPPWLYTFDGDGTHGRDIAGYHFLLSPPEKALAPHGGYLGSAVRIDTGRLLIEWAFLAAMLFFVRLVAPEPKPALEAKKFTFEELEAAVERLNREGKALSPTLAQKISSHIWPAKPNFFETVEGVISLALSVIVGLVVSAFIVAAVWYYITTPPPKSSAARETYSDVVVDFPTNKGSATR